MKKTVLRYNLSVLILYCAFTIQAQPGLNFIERLTVADGLSSNVITDIVQDQNGFLWIATENGLNRYDGTEVVQYFVDSDTSSIPNNSIRRLLRLDSFHLAIATDNGLSILDTRNYTFHNKFFQFDSSWLSYDNQLLFMEMDADGNLWLGTPVAIYRLNEKLKVEEIFRSPYNLDDIGNKRIRYPHRILPLTTGEVMIWLRSGLHIWNPQEDTLINLQASPLHKWKFLAEYSYNRCFQVYHYLIYYDYHSKVLILYDILTGKTSSQYFPHKGHDKESFITNITEHSNGWVALSFRSNGLAVARIEERDGVPYLSWNKKTYFPDKPFRKSMLDKDGNWWFTSETKGLWKISPDKQLFSRIILFNEKDNKSSPYGVTSFFRLDNKLLIASYGDGFYAWNLDLKQLNHHSTIHEFSKENKIWNISLHNKDTLWLGTQTGLMYYKLSNGNKGQIRQPHPLVLDSFAITAQFTDSKNLHWIGIGHGRGVCVYNKEKKSFHVYPNADSAYPYRYPYKIVEDRNCDLWFASDASPHLVRWKRKLNRFEKIIIPQFKGNPYVHTGTLNLDYKNNVIWYGAVNAGLVRYDISTGKVKIYGINDGLNNTKIQSLEEDKNGIIWLATNQGISSFNPITEQFVNYTSQDGLPGILFSGRFLYDKKSHLMYTGTMGKVVYFSPANFTYKKPFLYTMITSIKVNNKQIVIPENNWIELSSKENDISLSYTAVNLSDGKNNIYAYRLGGVDDKWIEVYEKRQIRLASLNPGHYTFMVKAARRGGDWSPFADRVDLIIRPPFVKTIWFYLLSLLIIGGIIYAWYRYRLSNILRLESMRSRISHDLHDDIGSRLTNISLMSQIAKQKKQKSEKRDRWLTQIQDESFEILQNMREIVWNINPSNDSLVNAMPKMLRYASELLENKNIVVCASIGNLQGIKMNMEERRDLFLTFKEAIHNIVRHSSAQEALIVLEKEHKSLHLHIEDDGKGFEITTLKYKSGLLNMQKRAKRQNWELNIRSKMQLGTQVDLFIRIT